ncbi:MAG: GTPase [Nanoarchaeota archaeon]
MRIRYSFSSRKTRQIEGNNRHKRPFPDVVHDMLKMADIIIEVIDARFIDETRNLELEEAIHKAKKRLVYVFNKSDVADISRVKKEISEKRLTPFVLLSCKTFMGKKRLRERLQIETKRLHLSRRALVGIIGYPNTGKSSLINMLTGRKTVGTSPQAGFTKGLQKIAFTRDIHVIDTPGVISKKDSPATEKENIVRSVKIGIKTYDRVKNPLFVVAKLMRNFPGIFDKYYEFDSGNDPEILIEHLGKKHNLLAKGGIIDSDRTARLILKDWQTGKIKL